MAKVWGTSMAEMTVVIKMSRVTKDQGYPGHC